MHTFQKLLMVPACLLVLAGCSRESRIDKALKKGEELLAAGKYAEAELEFKTAQQTPQPQPRALVGLGEVYLNQGRLDRASAFLAKAKELLPDDVDVRLKLGMCQLSLRQPAEARSAARFVLERRPADPEAPLLLADTSQNGPEVEESRAILKALPAPAVNGAPALAGQAMLALKEKKYDEADALITRARAADAKYYAINSAQALLHLARNEPEKADAALQAVTETAPNRVMHEVRWAAFKLQQKDVAAARRILEGVVQRRGDYVPALLALAHLENSEQKADVALELANKAVATEPFGGEAILLAGQIKLQRQDWDGAIVEFERLLSLFPNNPMAHFHLARAHVGKGELNKAIVSLQTAIGIDPAYPPPVILFSTLHLRKGEPAPAEAPLRRLLQSRADFSPAWEQLGEVLRALGRNDEAWRVYDALLKAAPQNAGWTFRRGELSVRLGRATDAKTDLTKALELDKTQLGALELLIGIAFGANQGPEALRLAQASVQANPQSARPQLILARVHLTLKEADKAEAALKRAIELEPDASEPYLALAQFYGSTQKHDGAVASLETLLAKNPKSAQALLLKGMLLEAKKDYAGARTAYEGLLAADPQSWLALNNLAYIQLDHFKDPSKAREYAAKAREVAPGNPAVADTLGWSLSRLGQYAQAEPLLKEALAGLPDNPEVLFHLGVNSYYLGQEEAARKALQQALKLAPDFAHAAEAKARLAILDFDPAKAGAEVRKLIETELNARKDDPLLLSRLALLQERAGELKEALASWQAAAAASPTNASFALGIVRILEAQGEGEKALEAAKAARKIASADPDVARALGRLASRQGQHSWGLSLLREAARGRPGVPEVQLDLAEGAAAAGDHREAESALQELVQRHAAHPLAKEAASLRTFLTAGEAGKPAPTALEERRKAAPRSAWVLWADGRLAEKAGDAVKARAAYEQLLTAYPEHQMGQQRLAVLWAGGSDADAKRSLEYATKSRERFPDDPEVAKALGVVLFRQGNFNRAATLLGEAAQKREKDADLQRYLGLALRQAKRPSDARKALETALALKLSGEAAEEVRRALEELKAAESQS
jgi:tetratricopeptide (TPR) repeat protein